MFYSIVSPIDHLECRYELPSINNCLIFEVSMILLITILLLFLVRFIRSFQIHRFEIGVLCEEISCYLP